MTNETEATDLLPCPFCGCAPVDLEHAKMVRCRDANCPLGQRWSSMDKWNIRADLSDAKDARVAELEARLAKATKTLQSISTWREDCHRYDADCGHELRDFDVVDVAMLEANAAATLAEIQT